MNRLVFLSGVALALVVAGEAAAQQLKEQGTLAGHTEVAACLAFSPDGKILATGSLGYDRTTSKRWGELKLWEAESGKEIASLQGHKHGIAAVAFSPDGKTLATAAYNDVILWDLAARKQRLTLKRDDSNLRGVAFSSDSQLVGCVCYQGARVWDVASGQEKGVLKGLLGDRSPAFSSDLKTLAAPCHQDVDLFDLATNKLRLTLEDHRGSANQVRFSSDGKHIVVVSTRMLDDQTYRSEVRFWDAASGQLLRTLRPDLNVIRSSSLSPDGKLLAICGGKSHQGPSDVVLIDPVTEREVARVPQKAAIHEILFSPDGGRVASSVGTEIKLWEVLPQPR